MARKKKQGEQKKDLATLRAEVEAILFAAAKRVSMEELKRVCGAEENSILEALQALKAELEQRDSAVMLQEDDRLYKLTVREKYLPLVEDIVTDTELPKSVLETLAVVAFRHPIYQSDLVKIRSNKCYDHLADLEERGFVRREKAGRTKVIHLTQKFFDYFELPPNKVKEAFASYEAVSREIEKKEFEVLEEDSAESDGAEATPTVSVLNYEEEQTSSEQSSQIEEEPDQSEVPAVESYSEDTTPMGQIEIINEDTQSTENEESEEASPASESGQTAAQPVQDDTVQGDNAVLEDSPVEGDSDVAADVETYPARDEETQDLGDRQVPSQEGSPESEDTTNTQNEGGGSDYFSDLRPEDDDVSDDEARDHLYSGGDQGGSSQAGDEGSEPQQGEGSAPPMGVGTGHSAGLGGQAAGQEAPPEAEESQAQGKDGDKVEEQADKILERIDKRVDEIFKGGEESSEGSTRDKRLQSLSEDIEKEKDELKE